MFWCHWFCMKYISQPQNTQIIKLKSPYASEVGLKPSQASEEIHLVQTLGLCEVASCLCMD